MHRPYVVNAFALQTAALVGAALIAPAHAQTAQEGKAAFAACVACHSVDGSVRPAGPTLKGIVGRKAAADTKYKAYSTALRNSKITWTAQELDAYLKAPTAKVKGTTMMVGVPDEKRRKAIIAYLRTLK
jgi:cytochrome c